MITAKQIRAARAMMNESRESFAKIAGVHKNTLANVEAGKLTASNTKIMNNLKKAGFEFEGTSGVRMRETSSYAFYGAGSADKFYLDILTNIKNSGGPLLASFATMDDFLRALGIESAARMDRLDKLCKFGPIKCNLSEARNSHAEAPAVQVRAVQLEAHQHWATIVYANRLAIIITLNPKSFYYYVSDCVEAAQAETKFFYERWSKGFAFKAVLDGE
jgi:DNA-binding XRE family transcriptional regulator